MGKIDKRLDNLEKAVNPPGDTVIKVIYIETDPITGEERDALTHELIPPPAPGVQVILVKYDDDSEYGQESFPPD
jgi:hypothetical protein